MKTRLDWPQPRDPLKHEPVFTVFWSVFPDVVGLWSVEDSFVAGEDAGRPVQG